MSRGPSESKQQAVLRKKTIKSGCEMSSGIKQQAVLRAACCVFGARCNIVRDVVFDALLSRPCAWLHQDGCLVAFAKGALSEEYLSHNFDEQCLEGH